MAEWYPGKLIEKVTKGKRRLTQEGGPSRVIDLQEYLSTIRSHLNWAIENINTALEMKEVAAAKPYMENAKRYISYVLDMLGK